MKAQCGLKKVIDRMQEKGMDVAVLVNSSNVRYVSGFDMPAAAGWMGDVSEGLPMAAAVVSASRGEVFLAASDLYRNMVFRAGIMDGEFYRSFTHLEVNDPEENFAEAFRRALGKAADGKEKPVVGIEPNDTTFVVAELIRKAFPECSFENASQILRDSRYIKTLEDIRGLKEAARAADASQVRLYEISRSEGAYTELDIWYEVQKAASQAVGAPVPFVGELVTGPRTGLSDYPLGPTTRRVERGDIAIMDISPRVDGYWGDCSNSVVFWAEPDEEQRRYFGAVRDAYEAGLAAIRPGVRFNEVNRVMEEQYEKHGLAFCSYQGHQIGCNVNEKPRFTYVDDSVLEENMVVCIEPQMYTGKAGKTGVRLERMLHVTGNGAVELNRFPWGL